MLTVCATLAVIVGIANLVAEGHNPLLLAIGVVLSALTVHAFATASLEAVLVGLWASTALAAFDTGASGFTVLVFAVACSTSVVHHRKTYAP